MRCGQTAEVEGFVWLGSHLALESRDQPAVNQEQVIQGHRIDRHPAGELIVGRKPLADFKAHNLPLSHPPRVVSDTQGSQRRHISVTIRLAGTLATWKSPSEG